MTSHSKRDLADIIKATDPRGGRYPGLFSCAHLIIWAFTCREPLLAAIRRDATEGGIGEIQNVRPSQGSVGSVKVEATQRQECSGLKRLRCTWPTGGKERGTSVLQSQGTEFCQQAE